MSSTESEHGRSQYPRALVLDTNLFVAAAFNPRSHSARLMARVRAGEAVAVWSADTRRETYAVLSRIPRLDPDRFADLFDPSQEYAGPVDLLAFREVEDADDRKFAALAAATGALLVTNDAHLLVLRGRLPVMMPREAVRLWGEEGA